MKPASPVLISSTNWIGDAVMSVAALREMRLLLPGHHLALLARPWVAGLFEGQGLVDEILPAGPAALGRVAAFRRFPAVLLLANSFRSALGPFLARVPCRLGYRTDGRGFLLTRGAIPRSKRLGRHQVYYYLDLLHQLGLSARDYLTQPDFRPNIRLSPTPAGREAADRLLASAGLRGEGPLVVLSPGAFYGSAKRWFADRYAAVADRLVDSHDAEVVLVGSAGEVELGRQVVALMRRPAHLLTGRTDLAALLAVLARSRLLLTNDSGTMHLAAALDTPQIALFGSTDEAATGPLSGRARVIHKHVECSPCLLRECPIDLRCFSRITVEEVYEAARTAL